MDQTKEKLPGVVIGIVKGFEDPAGEGRIELEFPRLPDPHRSGFAPVAAPLAGKDRGLFLMPEPNDEVLVAFLHGNFEDPYIVGYLWNGVDKPPRSTPSTRVLVTPGNHMLEFEDDATKPKITLKSAGNHSIEIDDTAATITVRTSGGQQIVLSDMPGSIELRGGGTRRLALENNMVVIT